MANDYITAQLKKEFSERETFSRKDLFEFYRRFNPDLKETTFRWRIYDLKEKKIIQSLSRGYFSLNYKPVFKPAISPVERKLITKIIKEFPSLKYCIWSTIILNQFMLHQAGKFNTILEVEKDALEPLFHYLKDINTNDVYLLPKEKELELYVYERGAAVILEPLISKAPVQKVDDVMTTTMEKLIVDIFTDKLLFSAFQGNELANIIDTACAHYQIDYTKLLSYAGRRRQDAYLKAYLLQQTDIPQLF